MGSQISRRTFLKAAVATLGLAAAAPAVTACSTTTSTGLTRLDMWAFSSTRTAWQQKSFQMYYSKGDYRGTKYAKYGGKFDINFLILPYGQMHDKLMVTAQAGQGGPDIADVEISRYSQFIKGGANAFVRLNELLKDWNAEDALFKGSATDPWSWQGEINGLGNELNACAMAYRWDLFDKYGIKAPIKSYEQMREIGMKLSKDTGGNASIIDIDIGDWGYWWMMTLQRGGGFFDQNGLPEWQKDPGVQTMQFLQDALYKDKWAAVAASGPSRYATFINGQILAILGPTWNISGFPRQNLAQTNGKWMVQPMPIWESTQSAPTATWGGTGVSVPKASKNRDYATDFVLWEHLTPDAVIIDYKERNVFPTLKAAWSDPKTSQAILAPDPWFNNQKVGEIFRDNADKIPKWYNSPYWPEGTDAMVRVGLVPALRGSDRLPAATSMPAAAKEADRIINFESA